MALSFWSLPPLLIKLCSCEIKYSFTLWKFESSSPNSDSRMVLRLRNSGNEWKKKLKGQKDRKYWCRNTSVSDIKIGNGTCPAASHIYTIIYPVSAWSHNCVKQKAPVFPVWLMVSLFAFLLFLLHTLTTDFNWLQDFRLHSSACIQLIHKYLLSFASAASLWSHYSDFCCLLMLKFWICHINYPLIRGICMSSQPFFFSDIKVAEILHSSVQEEKRNSLE